MPLLSAYSTRKVWRKFRKFPHGAQNLTVIGVRSREDVVCTSARWMFARRTARRCANLAQRGKSATTDGTGGIEEGPQNGANCFSEFRRNVAMAIVAEEDPLPRSTGYSPLARGRVKPNGSSNYDRRSWLSILTGERQSLFRSHCQRQWINWDLGVLFSLVAKMCPSPASVSGSWQIAGRTETRRSAGRRGHWRRESSGMRFAIAALS